MGKTGLIHHVFQQMEEQYEGVKCFYLDIFATKNLEQMVQLMASEINRKTGFEAERGKGKLEANLRVFVSNRESDAILLLMSFSKY